MGQKVNPIGIRLGITQKWRSTWYADGSKYADYLFADIEVRNYLISKFKAAGISRVQIERPANNARIVVYAARPGVILGKKGGDIEELRKVLSKKLGVPVHVSVEEVKKADLDARLVAEAVADQIVRRIAFRKAMKRAVQSALKAGAQGIKISASGRLAGSEIARREWYREGRVPLHTFRADVDYGLAEAKTTYGIIGVKVWIFRGEMLGDKEEGKREATNIKELREKEVEKSGARRRRSKAQE